MRITEIKPEKKYPYLAVYTGGGDELKEYTVADIVLISQQQRCGNSCVIYVQSINGNREGYQAKTEDDYTALPSGTKIELIQQ